MTDDTTVSDAIGQAFGRTPATPDPVTEAVSSALAGNRADTSTELTEATARAFGRGTPTQPGTREDPTDRAIAEAFGRTYEAPALNVQEQVRRDLEQQAVRETASTPWRDACRVSAREDLARVEEEFAGLVSTRRGQTIEAARRYVQQTLREAWHNPTTGFGTTHDRLVSVGAALNEGITRLSRIPAITHTASEANQPRRMVNITKEVRS